MKLLLLILTLAINLVYSAQPEVAPVTPQDSIPAGFIGPPQEAFIPSRGTYVTGPSPFLNRELEELYKHSRLRGRLAFSVYSTKYGRIEASLNDTNWFTPASCLKLIVTAAALDTFPINFFPSTVMEVLGRVENHVLTGTIRISGQGDPNVSDRFFPDALSPLEPFIDSLRSLGIDTIRGNVEVTDTFFTGPRRPEAWKQHHFNTWYGAEVSALSYNDNTFTLTVLPAAKPGAPAVYAVTPDVGYVRIINKSRTAVGKKRRIVPLQNPDSTVITLTGIIGTKAPGFQMILPVRNPTQYFRASFLKTLASQGLIYQPSPPLVGPPLLATYRFTTAPQIDVVEEINQRSQNLHAEMTLRQLGKFVKGEGNSHAGILAEKEFLSRLGLDTADFQLFDGCGLSSQNHIKPRAMAQLLAKMARHKYSKDYISSLAAPGMDGATGRRLRPYMKTNLVRFKTGSISGVQGLCGYVFGIDGDTLATTLFINEFQGSPESAQRLLDSLLMRVALWYNKERPALIEAHHLLARSDVPSGYIERLKYFSHALEEKPYFLGPTGEGRFGNLEPAPILDLTRFDCVTYIETVLALALSRETRDVLPWLMKLRYKSDTVEFSTRNHYFVQDWLKKNASLTRVYRFPGDTLIHKPIDKIKFFQSKKLPSPASNPICDIAFLPYAKALDLMAHWTYGDKFLGVAFVTDLAGLDVTHTGFLVVDDKGVPQLRNASQLKNKVTTMPFKDYLDLRKGKCAGVLFFEFLPPTI